MPFLILENTQDQSKQLMSHRNKIKYYAVHQNFNILLQGSMFLDSHYRQL
jgi:hypothetical protein